MAIHSPRPPSTVTVACRCGAYHIVAVSTFGRSQVCGKCKCAYTVLWKKDEKSGKKTPVVVTPARSRRLRSPKPGPSPESMIDLACACGYQRKATSDELRKVPHCPGCGKPMYVDRPPRVKPKAPDMPSIPFIEKTRYGAPEKPEPPASKPAPRAAAGETKISLAGKIPIVCAMCGDRLFVAAAQAGKRVKCLRCDAPMTVPTPPAPPPTLEEAVFDVAEERATPAPAAPRKPPPDFLSGPTLDCLCGESFDVRGASPGSVYTCAGCGRKVTMQKSRHPQTLSTVMKPIFEDPPPETLLDVSMEPGALEILCACGEALLVSLKDVGHPIQCPGCAMLMEIERAAGGLRVKPMGRIDGQSWSLEDFL